ncbi:MAG: hypothetical protein PHT44_02395 [Candidatus Portnoybacteria bacterium]|nr:hypothetical protein [Candidatus Portnoybacteria bacterium]MDD4982391.1 hypothetical protein [Candidatus Portnoybacteria bacterium]
MKISPAEKIILWGRSAGICNKCKGQVTHTSVKSHVQHKGEDAHIEGKEPGSARYNKSMTEKERACYANHILLCSSCHTEIDKDPIAYTVDILKKIKLDHEDWVKKKLIMNLPQITFSELEDTIKYLVKQYDFEVSTLDLITPQEKIKKNDLSLDVVERIKMGLSKVTLVKRYLNSHPDTDFAERLKRGFIEKYRELREKGNSSDGLFYILSDFASSNSADILKQAAGLSVLIYFFEQCDIFEK